MPDWPLAACQGRTAGPTPTPACMGGGAQAGLRDASEAGQVADGSGWTAWGTVQAVKQGLVQLKRGLRKALIEPNKSCIRDGDACDVSGAVCRPPSLPANLPSSQWAPRTAQNLRRCRLEWAAADSSLLLLQLLLGGLQARARQGGRMLEGSTGGQWGCMWHRAGRRRRRGGGAGASPPLPPQSDLDRPCTQLRGVATP